MTLDDGQGHSNTVKLTGTKHTNLDKKKSVHKHLNASQHVNEFFFFCFSNKSSEVRLSPLKKSQHHKHLWALASRNVSTAHKMIPKTDWEVCEQMSAEVLALL